MKLLITGATGKLGQNFLPQLMASDRFRETEMVTICNNRSINEYSRVRVVKGSIADRDTVVNAMDGVTHVLHMAAVKETPDQAIDVSIKGMFLLLESFRAQRDPRQFVLIGGDCSVGHIFHSYPSPITETAPRKAYPGCYALTKVVEEVMLEQYQLQYGLNGTILRAPWIMEKDDFRFAMRFGPDQFGGPAWSSLIPQIDVDKHTKDNAVPLMLDRTGSPLLRNFVHVDDLVSAILAALDTPAAQNELFNISMNQPVNYADAASIISQNYGQPVAKIETNFHSNWLDNTKARLRLNWQPETNLEALIERAWTYKRGANDPRKVWYPG